MRRLFSMTRQSRFRRAIVHILLITTATSFRLISPLEHQPAQAEEAPQSVIQQHWELLSETHLRLLGNTSLPLHRGSLPGGTTKFDPVPTAIFEIVAKVSAGLGDWQVALRDGSGTAIATIQIAAETNAYQILSASLAWPASDFELAEIHASNTAGGTRLLDIRKAYLKIEQSGIIKKTVARSPIATRQDTITGNSWVDVNDRIFYRHIAEDFDPAPRIYLRTTGRVSRTCQRFSTSLVDGSGEPVGGTLGPWGHTWHTDTQWTSQSSSDLDLPEGEAFHLQVRNQYASCFGVPAWGDLLSGDLVFEQSTDDPHGIIRTVAFASSVSSPIQTDMTGSHLNYLTHAPVNEVMSEKAVFDVSMKRVTGSTDAGVSLVYADSGELLATSVTSSDSWTYLAASIPVFPTAGAVLDTSSIVAEGVTGRVSQTIVRTLLTLRDIIGIVNGYLDNGVAFRCALGNRTPMTVSADGTDGTVQGRVRISCDFTQSEDPDIQPTEIVISATLDRTSGQDEGTTALPKPHRDFCNAVEDPCTGEIAVVVPLDPYACGDRASCVSYWTYGTYSISFPDPITSAYLEGTSEEADCDEEVAVGTTNLNCETTSWAAE